MVRRDPIPDEEGVAEGEQRLVEAAQRDPGRFGELYDLHFGRVYAFVARRVSDRSGAEDLTSEVFHHALANLPRFEWRGAPFGAWLFRIASNAIADHYKRVARETGDPVSVEPAQPPPEGVERRASLYRAVEELPEDQRRVIRMRFGQERSIREVAGELGRSEGAVKQLQFRALKNLRSRLDTDNV